MYGYSIVGREALFLPSSTNTARSRIVSKVVARCHFYTINSGLVLGIHWDPWGPNYPHDVKECFDCVASSVASFSQGSQAFSVLLDPGVQEHVQELGPQVQACAHVLGAQGAVK